MKQDRAQVTFLADEVQRPTGQLVTLACADQGYTGPVPAEAAQADITLEEVKPDHVKKGFVPLPKH